MSSQSSPSSILYTLTDEAPALATQSWLPIIKAFVQSSGVNIETVDISLASRILGQFPQGSSSGQNILETLAQKVKLADTNIIKLPNISASETQLKAAIVELQAQGFDLPDYPESPTSDEQKTIKTLYDQVKGSAINPVLREGNSDRRVPQSVKTYAQNNPHTMGVWENDSKTHVASMSHDDFYGSEQSITMNKTGQFKIELVSDKGIQQLRDFAPFLQGEILDCSRMSKSALREFLTAQIADAKSQGLLLSVHLKATMMKVSDPIIFGHVVYTYFKPVFDKYAETFKQLNIHENNGLSDLLNKLDNLSDEQALAIKADIQKCIDTQADLAMVDSDKGITNLHVSSDVIIDASMPAAIRASGKMWNKVGELADTKAIIPDRCYAGIYQQTIDFCKKHGAFDPSTMGSVQNIGLMAQKAEEYGSHDKTFEISTAGQVRVIDDQGNVLLEQNVEAGDIWRMCQTKDAPIQNWIKLAVHRAQLTQLDTLFWLDKHRAHDAELIKKVKYALDSAELKDQFDLNNLSINIMSPNDAINFSMDLIKKGQDCISVTGNVLRDYLTDLFPILELGTSAKMLSIVPLMNGGGLFETGAGGSAPKHVQQFLTENHLRWDSLGEFLALSESLKYIANKDSNDNIALLAQTLDDATAQLLMHNQSPSRKVHELDNRGSHFYLCLYWAKALAEQNNNKRLQQKFSQFAQDLEQSSTSILTEINALQGTRVDLGAYYHPQSSLVEQFMRPSIIFNQLLENFTHN